MKGLKFLAIIVGLVVDIFGSLLSGLFIGIAMVIFYASQGMSMKEISVQLDAAHLNQSLPFLLSSAGVGGFFTVVGGFVTGWMAKTYELKNALIMGLLSVAFGALFWSFSPMWFNVAGALITPPSAMAGGYFAQCIFTARNTARQ